MSKSFLQDSREKQREGSKGTVKKLDNQEAGKTSKIKHKKNRGQRWTKPKGMQGDAFSIKL